MRVVGLYSRQRETVLKTRPLRTPFDYGGVLRGGGSLHPAQGGLKGLYPYFRCRSLVAAEVFCVPQLRLLPGNHQPAVKIGRSASYRHTHRSMR